MGPPHTGLQQGIRILLGRALEGPLPRKSGLGGIKPKEISTATNQCAAATGCCLSCT